MGDRQTRIAVIGGWHQSSVVSACFADMGYRVTGICDDTAVAAALEEAIADPFQALIRYGPEF